MERPALMDRLADHSARVAVIGLGYVGLPLAVTAARAGFAVTGFDIDQSKMTALSAGQSYIEAVSDTALQDVAETFAWTTDFSRLAEMDVIVICVPTPLTEERTPDLSFVETTARQIAQHLRPGRLVVLESTTWPGTTREVLTPILESNGLTSGRDVFVAFSPEREDPGNDTYRTHTIPKIVAGDGTAAADLVETFYSAFIESVIRVPDTATAEAVKITENVFRAVNIALVNELKLVYDAMGIDVWEVIRGASSKPFGYMPFWPGPGLGGHCIPIDPFYLSWRARSFDVNTRFIELAGEINTAMPQHVVTRTREVLDRALGRGLNGARILLVGVAYKKNVSDMRESPAMRLMQLLNEAGAEVRFIDPFVPSIPPMRDYPDYTGQQALDPATLRKGAFEAVLIATDHDAVDYAALTALDCPIIDTRNAMASRNLPLTRVTKV